MKILKLPFIVRDEVLKHMDSHEILFLSLLSEHARRSIRQSKFKRNGLRLTCGRDCIIPQHGRDVDEKRLEWMGEMGEEDKVVLKWKYVENLDTLNLVEEFEYLRKMGKNPVVLSGLNLKMNGLECRYSMSFENGIPTLYFEKNLKKLWPMELHKYVTHLFQTSSDLEVVLNLCDTSDFNESLVIKDLYLYSGFSLFASPFSTVDSFKKANIQNSVHGRGTWSYQPISDDSKFWSTPNVSTYGDGWILPRQLVLFTGKNARLYLPQVRGAHVNAFLKNWLNSDNPQLESIVVQWTGIPLIMPSDMHLGHLDGLYKGIQTSWWDPKKRQSRYVPKTPFGEERQYKFDHLDCTHAMDIERSDGLLASVRIQGQFLFMFVWHDRF